MSATGATMTSIDNCTVFLTRQTDVAGMNDVWRNTFPSDPPARSTVIVAALSRPAVGHCRLYCFFTKFLCVHSLRDSLHQCLHSSILRSVGVHFFQPISGLQRRVSEDTVEKSLTVSVAGSSNWSI
ncbi:RidA family protein [Paraburkholderia dilworthii]|uniref:RidA family protein n=1 Tax=Paraburkholderia dilworthii TaxID=948106 RepID=UPI003898DF51